MIENKIVSLNGVVMQWTLCYVKINKNCGG